MTLLILTMLLLAGPVQGFTLNLNLNDNSPTQGDKITFTAEIEIPSGGQLPIEYLILELNGIETLSCKFSPNGTILSVCKGITITQNSNSNSNYGYGYGYGYFNQNNNFGYGYGYQSGKLTYTITLDTNEYKTGTYATALKLKINSLFTQQGPPFTIEESSNDGSGTTTDSTSYYYTLPNTGTNTNENELLSGDAQEEEDRSEINSVSPITGATIGTAIKRGILPAIIIIMLILVVWGGVRYHQRRN